MVTLTVPVSTSQLVELVRQLSPVEKQRLLDALLCERFEAVLSECDSKRADQTPLSDEEIQTEIDAVRQTRYEECRSASRG